MNPDDALQQFCRQNLKVLTSVELSRDNLKGLVKDFFYTKHSNRFGQPSLKEIQVALVALLQKNGIAAEDVVQTIDKAQLFLGISDALRVQLVQSLSKKEY